MRDVALSLFAAGAALTLTGGAAFGSLTPIGAFVGGASESFESKAPGYVGPFGSSTAGPEPILGGAGILSGTTTHTSNPLYVWSSIGGLSLGLHGSGIPHDGTKGLVLNPYGTFNARIDFPTPVDQFGGYWAHASVSGNPGSIGWTFFDAGGGVIDTDAYVHPLAQGGNHVWRGWSSTTPIAAVEWTGFWATCDGLQVNVPAPGAACALGGAGLLALRRRRR